MSLVKLLAALAAASLACVMPAAAQQYPSKVVKLIVPQTPGGATDVFARKIGQLLSEKWGQAVVVENRAGAGGVVGTDVVAKSAPDGYTLLVTYAGSQAINQSLYPKIPFDSVKDFQTIATLASTPFVLIVNPNLPAKSLADTSRSRAPSPMRSPMRRPATARSTICSARCSRRMPASRCCTCPTGASRPPSRT